MMYVSYLSLLPYDDVLNSLTIQSSALGTYRLMCVFVWVGGCVLGREALQRDRLKAI